MNSYKSLEEIFKTQKPIIGMLHLDHLKGQKEFRSDEYVLSKALVDLYNLQDGGIDGVLIENWKEYTTTPEADVTNVKFMLEICRELTKRALVPLGVNVLNNDYKAAFHIAKEIGAKFVQLDTFVDKVKSQRDFNPYTEKDPLYIYPDADEIMQYKKLFGCDDISLFVFIQPKHYIMLEEKTIEESAREAVEKGADGIIVTGEWTGLPPSKELIKRVREGIDIGSIPRDYPIGIGSGFSSRNAEGYLLLVDFAIVGTDLKYGGMTDNPIDIERVRKIMEIKRKMGY